MVTTCNIKHQVVSVEHTVPIDYRSSFFAVSNKINEFRLTIFDENKQSVGYLSNSINYYYLTKSGVEYKIFCESVRIISKLHALEKDKIFFTSQCEPSVNQALLNVFKKRLEKLAASSDNEILTKLLDIFDIINSLLFAEFPKNDAIKSLLKRNPPIPFDSKSCVYAYQDNPKLTVAKMF